MPPKELSIGNPGGSSRRNLLTLLKLEKGNATLAPFYWSP
jgi:hypothetical protein